MGSYAYLALGGVTIHSSKHEVDPSVMVVFRESDRQVLPFPLEDWDEDEEDAPTHTVHYAATLGAVRDRLDLMGVTLAEVRAAFEEGIAAEATNEPTNWSLNVRDPDVLRALEEEQAELQTLSFDRWLHAFAYLAEGQFQDVKVFSPGFLRLPPLYRLMLRDPHESQFGFPSPDFRFFLRAVAELRSPALELVYDLSELIAANETPIDYPHAWHAARVLADDFGFGQAIIVLTEGRTDRWIVSQSLNHLYPHLFEYFSFMDFEGMRVPGGAGFLVATMKAFASAGVANRVIALFDNDTAAHAALRSISRVALPGNVRVLTCPRIPLAEKYPTLGPGGLTEMDVNGLAGSIELYLGRDVLTGPDGTLTPVQWRGFDESLQRYHGEVMNKRFLHERFREKIARSRADAPHVAGSDWGDMRTLLDALRNAFNTET